MSQSPAEYRTVAERIIAQARGRRDAAYARLEELTVHIGPRLSGSPALATAINWARESLARDGQEQVRVEPVMVPCWERGAEAAFLVAPRAQRLDIVGLGGSAPGRVTADVVVISSEEELARRTPEVANKIVLYNAIMAPYDPARGHGYTDVVRYRRHGADWAAAHGAVGVLVRSLTTRSLGTPHTGGMRYKGGVPRIPAAAITIEGAELLARLATRGPVTVTLELASTIQPDVESGNVLAELRGRERPNELVVISAHLDSWDTTPGAHDNGGGCVAVIEALAVLRQLGLTPRRTIRVVLFTNEENGLRGALRYAKDHVEELDDHVVVFESDHGMFRPRGFTVEGDVGLEQARLIAKLLEPIGATEARRGFSCADLIPLVDTGIPGVASWNDDADYFDYHHSPADTIDKVDPEHLASNVAAIAVFAYVAADLESRFDEP
jgi:carboxypeptidase Q